jgi:hypothetical protein
MGSMFSPAFWPGSFFCAEEDMTGEQMKSIKWAMAAAACVASIAADATTVDWGAHDDLEVAAILDSAGAFDDKITFTLANTSNLASTTVANNLTSVLGIGNGSVTLFKDNGGGSVTNLGSYAFDGSTGGNWHTSLNLSFGQYFYEIQGVANGSQGGFYSITSHITPAPEPESYALLLAGLGAIGLLYRRRQPR